MNDRKKLTRYGHANSTYLSNCESDGWNSPIFGFSHSGGILLTKHCPLKCKHCITDSHPNALGDLSTDIAIKFLNDLTDTKRTTFWISGGEALLRKDDVLAITRKAVELGFRSVILDTGCFWASSRKRVDIVILELLDAGITHLYISSDQYHSAFRPISHVLNAVHSCRLHELDYLIGITAPPILTDQMEEEIEVLISERAHFRVDPIAPFGRAAYFPKDAFCEYSDEYFFSPCSMMGPTLSWDGLYACCNIFHQPDSILSLGHYNESIHQIFNSVELLEVVASIESGTLVPDNPRKILGRKWRHDCEYCVYCTTPRSSV